MLSLDCEFCHLESRNPFWLASSPVADSAEMIIRAFEAGWGGAIYKTLGLEEKPGKPIVNVTPRLATLTRGRNHLIGMENIELITDRTLTENLEDISQIKKKFPNRPLFVSIMALPYKQDWQELTKLCEETGADGLELNLSCPHASISGQRAGASVGQHPDIARNVTSWVRETTSLPIMVKLPAETLNVRSLGQAVKAGGANAISAINTVPSIIGVDLDTLIPRPSVWRYSTSGGYSGPAIKPLALKKIAALASDPEINLPISGIGGVTNWRDALEFILLGSTTVQVCTAAMCYGYRIIDDLKDGVLNWMEAHDYKSITEFQGESLQYLKAPEELDRTRHLVAKINHKLCIKGGICYIACRDGGHQAIAIAEDRFPVVDEEKCKGCGLCAEVCPIEECITMSPRE